MTFLDNFDKIQFETGEVAWIRYEFTDTLYLVFIDLSAGLRSKSKLPKYKILKSGNKNKS